MEQSEQINELAAALSKAQAKIVGAEKSSANPFFKSKYADLASVWDACRKQLSENGLSVIQTNGNSEDRVTVTTLLVHSSGQWVRGTCSAKPAKDDAQGIGSVITYLRRYGLAAIAGVAPEDDDGNAASAKPMAKPGAVTQAQKKQVYDDTIRYLSTGDEHGLMETWHGFGSDEKVLLWSMFNSEQRSAIKALLPRVGAYAMSSSKSEPVKTILGESAIADYISSMDSTVTIEELTSVWKELDALASELGDANARQKFITAKDIMKARFAIKIGNSK